MFWQCPSYHFYLCLLLTSPQNAVTTLTLTSRHAGFTSKQHTFWFWRIPALNNPPEVYGNYFTAWELLFHLKHSKYLFKENKLLRLISNNIKIPLNYKPGQAQSTPMNNNLITNQFKFTFPLKQTCSECWTLCAIPVFICQHPCYTSVIITPIRTICC